jgi:site-specific DNA recombinase
MMETFDKQNVSFVSVTQQFNTATSMGRLILNVLLSFAQFEREMISERTRDKIAATRRKGKYGGGRPVLGYDRDPSGPRLVINADEAARVRTIFKLYLELQTVAAVVQELNRRGWLNKSWNTSKGQQLGGQPFTGITLHYLLKNPIYIGMLRYKEDLYEGEHDPIVDRDVWQRVQAQLAINGRQGNPAIRNKVGGLLRGLLHCSACNTTMMHTFTSKKGRRLYRYYVCSNAKKHGSRSCPSRSIPAEELEQFVVQQIRKIGSDEQLLAKTIEQAGRQSKKASAELKSEQRQLQRQFEECNAELIALASQIVPGNGQVTGQLAALQERISALEHRAAEVREELDAISRRTLAAHEMAQALTEFDPVWSMLTNREKIRIIHLLIERIDYNGATGEMSIAFRPNGIKTLSSASDEPENQE